MSSTKETPYIPPGYTLRVIDDVKYIIPTFAVAGLEAEMASYRERQRLGVDSVPFSVSFLFIFDCRCRLMLHAFFSPGFCHYRVVHLFRKEWCQPLWFQLV